MESEQRKWLDKHLPDFTDHLDLAVIVPYLRSTENILLDHHKEVVIILIANFNNPLQLASLPKHEANGKLIDILKTHDSNAVVLLAKATGKTIRSTSIPLPAVVKSK